LENKVFRNGRASDYISMSVGYDYVEYDSDDQIFKDIKKFLKSIQPNVSKEDIERRKYLKKFLASCIQSVNYDETFHIFTGMGRNGKSKLIEMIEFALGQYAGKLPISYLTKARGKSGDATPEVVKVKSCRFVTLQESDKKDKINNGILKEVTGNDKQTGRELYKSPIDFKPLYKLVLICNDIPYLEDPTDHAVHERLRIIDFPSRYVKGKINKSNSYEQLADTTLSKKIENWGPHMMALLIKWFHKYFPSTDVKLYPPSCCI
jgi:phage/plasmid-associated DNA primase